ncbi:hypothetical protein BSAF29S_04109 [Bacillus safensis subsp. safensis]
MKEESVDFYLQQGIFGHAETSNILTNTPSMTFKGTGRQN